MKKKNESKKEKPEKILISRKLVLIAIIIQIIINVFASFLLFDNKLFLEMLLFITLLGNIIFLVALFLNYSSFYRYYIFSSELIIVLGFILSSPISFFANMKHNGLIYILTNFWLPIYPEFIYYTLFPFTALNMFLVSYKMEKIRYGILWAFFVFIILFALLDLIL